MKLIIRVAIAAWLVLQCALVLAQGLITEEAAKQAVRDFENEPSLALTCVELQEDDSGPAWSHRSWYTLRTADYPASRRLWTVDGHSAEVNHASYADLGESVPYGEPGEPFTKEAYRPTAEDFAQSKYNGFDTMGFVLTMERWIGTGWLYGWQQRVTYDALTINMVAVVVAPETGYILEYTSIRVPTPNPPPPQVTSAEALDLAAQAAGIVEVVDVQGPLLVADPDGNVSWNTEIGGLDAEDRYVSNSVAIDAETGEVLSVSRARLPSSPPRDGRTGNPISIRDLAAKVPGARVHWLGKEAKLFVGRNRYTLVPGKDTIEWTGGTIKLSQKMKLVNGRLMVPSGLLDVLKSPPASKKAPSTPAKSK